MTDKTRNEYIAYPIAIPFVVFTMFVTSVVLGIITPWSLSPMAEPFAYVLAAPLFPVINAILPCKYADPTLLLCSLSFWWQLLRFSLIFFGTLFFYSAIGYTLAVWKETVLVEYGQKGRLSCTITDRRRIITMFSILCALAVIVGALSFVQYIPANMYGILH